jgi:hypothetical protein
MPWVRVKKSAGAIQNIELDASLVSAGPQYPGNDGQDLRPSLAVSPP